MRQGNNHIKQDFQQNVFKHSWRKKHKGRKRDNKKDRNGEGKEWEREGWNRRKGRDKERVIDTRRIQRGKAE